MCDNTRVNSEEQVKRMLTLQELLLKFIDIERMIYLPDAGKNRIDRRETDTEHSYHLAMQAWYLSAQYPHLDQTKVLRYALAHDLVEIYAGDVMAIGRTKEEQDIKDQREREALNRLKREWPDFNDLISAIEDYENGIDAEAKFVRALDKIMPILLQILSEGKTWKKWDMIRSSVIKNKDEKTKVSKEIVDIWKVLKHEIEAHDDWFGLGNAD